MVRGTAGAHYGGWATVAGSNFAISSSQFSDGAWIPLTNDAPLATDAGTDTNHSLLTNSATLTGSRSTGTLRIAPSALDQTLGLASHTLTLSTGGLLIPEENPHPYTLTGGTLRGAPAADLVIHQHGSADLTVSSTIADHDGATALTKTGPGTLVLGGANTYTGDTFVNQGKLRLASPAALPGATSLRFHGGTLDLAGHSITIESLTGIGTLQNSGSTPATLTTGATTALTLAPGQSISASDIQNTPALSLYQLWSADQDLTTGINDAPTDDPDHDGINNLAEFALDENPLDGSSDGKTLSKFHTIAGQNALTFTLPVRTGATFSGTPSPASAPIDGIIYQIHASTQLQTWHHPVTELTGPEATALHATLPAPNTGWSYRTFQAATDSPACYIRASIRPAP
jgi:autotransporter-associated beta strand protein